MSRFAVAALAILGAAAACDDASSSSQGDGAGGLPDGGAAPAAPVLDGVADGVMMQAFYWNVPQRTPDGSWWRHLEAQSSELSAAGIDALWIPPPYKGAAGADDVGYGVFDRYDLGEFDQAGSVATRYGTLAELQSMIAALHGRGMHVYADVVMNHMMGANVVESFTGSDGTPWRIPVGYAYPARNGKYSTYEWHANNFNGVLDDSGNWLQWHDWDFAPYDNGDAYDNLLGYEIRYADPANRAELVSWGQWLTTTLSLDGYRLDATKHMLTDFVTDWLDAVKGPRFAVSEAWMGDLDELRGYATLTGRRTRLFDVPLHYLFAAMSDGDGAWDMRQLKFAGLTEADGDLSVSFVDNHDTDNAGALHSPVVNFKLLAYAYVLTRHRGYPCVFYKDWYDYGLAGEIAKLIAIRKAHAYGRALEYDVSDENVYVYSRAGDATHGGLVLLLDDGDAATRRVTSPFRNATLVDATGHTPGVVTTDGDGVGEFAVGARDYAIWVPQ